MNSTEIFHWLHEHPELSFEEFETTSFIKKILSEDGIEILDLPLKTGLVARIKGAKPGKKIAFRADIDALPLEEKADLPYKSKNPGKMHACGHDIHISVGIETARLLNKRKNELSGEALFVFQPAEEAGNGSFEILNTGVLDGTEAVFSLHSSPLLEVGEIGIKEGAITSSVDILKILIKGTGSHGAQPQDGRDPIAASAAVINALQAIVSRNVSPLEHAVVSITHIQGGSNWNVIPDEVILEGTMRTTNEATRSFIKQRINEIIQNTAQAYGEKAEIVIKEGPLATNNDAELADFARKTTTALGFVPVLPEISMVGEDFAFFQKKYKGIMVWLGVGKTKPLHNPEFIANPAAIEVGAKLFLEMMLNV